VDELIAICMMHDVSVAVFKEVQGELTFVDGWFDGVEPLVCSKLTANSSKSVRSHFERLLLPEEWGQQQLRALPLLSSAMGEACAVGEGAVQSSVVANRVEELFGLATRQHHVDSSSACFRDLDANLAHATNEHHQRIEFSATESVAKLVDDLFGLANRHQHVRSATTGFSTYSVQTATTQPAELELVTAGTDGGGVVPPEIVFERMQELFGSTNQHQRNDDTVAGCRAPDVSSAHVSDEQRRTLEFATAESVARVVEDLFGFAHRQQDTVSGATSCGMCSSQPAGMDPIHSSFANTEVNSHFAAGMLCCGPCEVSCLPQRLRKYEFERWWDAAKTLAHRYLRLRATLPQDIHELDMGVRLPPVSCAFQNCTWTSENNHVLHPYARADVNHPWDTLLEWHIRKAHAEDISAVVAASFEQKTPKEDRLWDVYNEAIAVRERETFPVSGCSVDRRAFEYTQQVFNDDSIRSLICCVCARILLDTGSIRSHIRFKKGTWFFQLPRGSLKNKFSLDFFLHSDIDSQGVHLHT